MDNKKFITIDVQGFFPAVIGMRHPLKSYERADSRIDENGNFVFGKNDYDLAKRLCSAGSPEHAKFLRMIDVWVDITAPLYWWQEYATYKVGTCENSQSTMHRLWRDGIQATELDYNWGVSDAADSAMIQTLGAINALVKDYGDVEDKEVKDQIFFVLKSLVPSCYMQTRTCHLSYAVLRNMYKQRKNHRLPQWNTEFVTWVKSLPYAELITDEW